MGARQPPRQQCLASPQKSADGYGSCYAGLVGPAGTVAALQAIATFPQILQLPPVVDGGQASQSNCYIATPSCTLLTNATYWADGGFSLTH